MTRTITPECLALLAQWEGLRLEAYRNFPGEPWTIGYGSTGPDVIEGMKITKAEAGRRLKADLARFEEAVDSLVTVPLTDNQFGALVSFAFNIGTGAFKGSTLLKKLNAGDYDAVPSELARWNKVGGKVVAGLVNRRAAEAGLWARGAFVVSAGPTTAEPQVAPLLTKENAMTAATVVGSLGTVAAGSGPMQYAFAALLVIGALVGSFLFIKHRLRPS